MRDSLMMRRIDWDPDDAQVWLKPG